VLFNTPQFGLFLFVVLALHHATPRPRRWLVLLGASSIFYAAWVPQYLILLLLDIGVNYVLLRSMLVSRHRRLHLIVACVFTLGLLAYFKYIAMLVETALAIPGLALAGELPIPDVVLPLGISFYSFQILAFTIDVYRGRTDEIPSFGRYALFVSFFPQLIAGPILRGSQLLPQIAVGGAVSQDRARRGVWLLASGLAKKVVLADFLLAPFVDRVFESNALGSSPFALIGLYSFAFQIYYDFSGYCDMARGIALLLGYELPLNFMEPYLSRDPTEFWRRWHITLSRWLADYLYIPLGGNRRGTARTRINLMLTMLLGGLWHGASWSFVAWGGLHGLLLVLHRSIGGRRTRFDAPLRASDLPRMFLLFNVVCLIWVFFRAETLDGALQFLGSLFSLANPDGWPLVQCLIVALCALLHGAERWCRLRLPALRLRLQQAWWGPLSEGAVAGAILGACIMLSGVGGDFIYFQF
jgi:alginate O-acetyltransferase complex protein AlgI